MILNYLLHYYDAYIETAEINSKEQRIAMCLILGILFSNTIVHMFCVEYDKLSKVFKYNDKLRP